MMSDASIEADAAKSVSEIEKAYPHDIEGFDPKHDAASSPQRMRFNVAYRREVQRGNIDLAERIRRMPTQRKQLRLISRECQQFDPEHYDARSSSKVRVRSTYRALRDRGFDDEADELRALETIREQMRRANEYRYEFDLGVHSPLLDD